MAILLIRDFSLLKLGDLDSAIAHISWVILPLDLRLEF